MSGKKLRESWRPIRWLFKGALVRDKEVLGWKVESGKEVRTIVGVEWRESMSFSELTRQGGVEAGRSGNGQAVNGWEADLWDGVDLLLWELLSLKCFKWQPTPVFLPGEPHGQGSLAGYSLWGYKRVGHNLVNEQQIVAQCWLRLAWSAKDKYFCWGLLCVFFCLVFHLLLKEEGLIQRTDNMQKKNVEGGPEVKSREVNTLI